MILGKEKKKKSSKKLLGNNLTMIKLIPGVDQNQIAAEIVCKLLKNSLEESTVILSNSNRNINETF